MRNASSLIVACIVCHDWVEHVLHHSCCSYPTSPLSLTIIPNSHPYPHPNTAQENSMDMQMLDIFFHNCFTRIIVYNDSSGSFSTPCGLVVTSTKQVITNPVLGQLMELSGPAPPPPQSGLACTSIEVTLMREEKSHLLEMMNEC